MVSTGSGRPALARAELATVSAGDLREALALRRAGLGGGPS